MSADMHLWARAGEILARLVPGASAFGLDGIHNLAERAGFVFFQHYVDDVRVWTDDAFAEVLVSHVGRQLTGELVVIPDECFPVGKADDPAFVPADKLRQFILGYEHYVYDGEFLLLSPVSGQVVLYRYEQLEGVAAFEWFFSPFCLQPGNG